MAKLSPQDVNQLIRSRKSVFPATYINKDISEDIILDILENANWAPTHRKTEPWRFCIIRGEGRQRLADELSRIYQATVPEPTQTAIKLKKIKSKPLQSNTIIAICMHRDPKASVPEWEEVAAMSMAVQNIWLSLEAHDIGAYWSSPTLIEHLNTFLSLKENERCYGLFYMGYHQSPNVVRNRGPVASKTTWINK